MISCQSFMRKAVTISTPARADSGIFAITGPRINMKARSPSAWKIPVSLVRAPDFNATLVRAMAAVAGIPPKNGRMILPIPWATSSWSLFSLTFAILPALAPHSRLSIIPSMAILTAGPINPLRFAGVMAAKSNRVSRKSVFGMAPTVWMSSLRLTDRMVARIMLKKEAGTTAFHFLGKKTMNRTTKSPRPAACILTGKPRCP